MPGVKTLQASFPAPKCRATVKRAREHDFAQMTDAEVEAAEAAYAESFQVAQ